MQQRLLVVVVEGGVGENRDSRERERKSTSTKSLITFFSLQTIERVVVDAAGGEVDFPRK